MAISGCGPAFVAMMIEALADAGVKYGLPRATAYRLASQTALGTGKMQLETGMHPGVIKDGVCSPAGTTIRGVEALEEYGMRRRALLPPGGVLQEKESLDLLASVAALYCGDGFILAVRKGEDSLILAELLGDTGAASKITRALGYSRARIRIPGRERRFSMIYRLCDKHISPSYFGLAFD